MSTKQMKVFKDGLSELELLVKDTIEKIEKTKKGTPSDISEFKTKWDMKIKEFKETSSKLQKAFFHQHELLRSKKYDSEGANTALELKNKSEAEIKRILQLLRQELKSDSNVTIETIVNRGIPERKPNPDLGG